MFHFDPLSVPAVPFIPASKGSPRRARTAWLAGDVGHGTLTATECIRDNSDGATLRKISGSLESPEFPQSGGSNGNKY